jgi:hypothetical protein
VTPTPPPRTYPEVYLSDITDELAINGLTWNAVGIHWPDIIDALVDLVGHRQLPALAFDKSARRLSPCWSASGRALQKRARR